MSLQVLDRKIEKIEFLLEEPSMENFLREVLPKILPVGYVLDENCFLRPHNGKSDLQRSIPKKVRAFSNPYEMVLVVILHDQDANNCLELKQKLLELCQESGNCSVLIRIVCKELESWYLGDMDAIQSVFPRFKAAKYRNKEKFRNPDSCNASDELKKILPDFQKGFASREISKHINIAINRSTSFNQFIQGINNFLK